MYPDRVREMISGLVERLESDGAKLPRPNTNYVPWFTYQHNIGT